MVKSKIKVMSIILSMALIFSTMSGCRKKIANDANTLEILIYKAGYGTAFLDPMIEVFEKKYNCNVEYTPEEQPKTAAMLTSGPNNNTVDLFFSNGIFHKMIDDGAKALSGYESLLLPLNDVYEAIPDGETIAVKDKMKKVYLENAQVEQNGKTNYYTFPWADGLTGLIYNKTQFDKLSIAEPRTTDELIEDADKILAAKKTPFVFSSLTGYWEYLREYWHAQYEGAESYYNFYEGLVPEGDSFTYSKDVFKQQGRLESLKALESLIGYQNGRIHANVNTFSYTEAQGRFLLGDGLMVPSGDWFEEEMRGTINKIPNVDEFLIMRTPIISSITDKTPTINDDITLRAVVDFVDGVTTKAPVGVSEDDIKTIRDAREVVYSIGSAVSAVIPTYATASDLAKKFLLFMASDEGQRIFIKASNGSNLPFNYDIKADKELYDGLSAFEKKKFEIYSSGESLSDTYKYPIRYKGGLGAYTGDRTIMEVPFCAKNANDRKTAQQLFDAEIAWHNDSFWNGMMVRSGLK